jgi:surface antigen
MIYADDFYVGQQSLRVADQFLHIDSVSTTEALQLNMVWLIPVDVSDGITKYVVQRGDSLGKIAAEFGTTTQKLKETNGINGNTLSVGQELFVTDVSGIIYNAKENTNFLVFSNKYDLDLEDVMTLNYVIQEDAPIYEWDELFLPVTLEKAYALWLEERPKPTPTPVARPQSVVAQASAPQPASVQAAVPITADKPATQIAAPAPTTAAKPAGWPYAGQVVATRRDGSTRVSNGFYAGFCTYWAAKKRPDIFPYISDTAQSRPFGGNARAWLANASAAGIPTGYNPAVGAIAVFGRWGGWYAAYGHVGIIIKIDRDRRLFLMEEMNGASGKWYVDHRWISMDDGNISGYIY